MRRTAPQPDRNELRSENEIIHLSEVPHQNLFLVRGRGKDGQLERSVSPPPKVRHRRKGGTETSCDVKMTSFV